MTKKLLPVMRSLESLTRQSTSTLSIRDDQTSGMGNIHIIFVRNMTGSTVLTDWNFGRSTAVCLSDRSEWRWRTEAVWSVFKTAWNWNKAS